jgi:isopenicillin N synthase-like dioxygenase
MQQFLLIDISTFSGGQSAKRTLAQQVDEICCHTGFMGIVGHGLSAKMIARTWDATRRFFDLPLEQKLEVKMPYTGYPYGYAPLQTEALAGSLGHRTPSDLKESFSIGPLDRPCIATGDPEVDYRLAPNLWPREPADFKEAWSTYYRSMGELAAMLMRIFALGLGLAESFFDDKIDQHPSAMRALNYPHQTSPPKIGQLRAGAHTDYGSLTILLSEPAAGGLEIFTPDGKWLAVPLVPGAFIVNIGDLLARWTNDRWVSTLHRVVCPPLGESHETRRQSIAFFHQPNWDAEITCLPTCLAPGAKAKYESVTSGAHLREKFRRAFLNSGGR